MYEVKNGVTSIDGIKGKYDDKTVTNPSERYGRNAVDNFYSYAEQPLINDQMNTAPILDFGISPNATEENAEKLGKFIDDNEKYLNALPPLEFEYRYMPNINKGQIDKKALLGAAYEEMGKRSEIDVKEMDANYTPSDEYTFKTMDLNNDGKISNAEYSTSMLAADMFSKSKTPDTKNIDGTINANGLNALMEYSKKNNAAAAAALYSNLYKNYNLGEANQ